MRKNGIRSAVVIINNQPCDGPMGCDALVPVVSPPGYTLTVYGQIVFGENTKELVRRNGFPRRVLLGGARC